MSATKKSSIKKAARSKSKGTGRRKTSAPVPSKRRAATAVKPSSIARGRKAGFAPGLLPPHVRVKVPAILREGDAPATPSLLRRRRTPPTTGGWTQPATPLKALPDAYGSRNLKLTARDPHWLNAYWDFTRDQLREANAQSADGHLVVRLFRESVQGALVSETHVHPESSRWMVHVPQSGTPYAAEIGFYDERQAWSALAASNVVCPPPSGASADQGFELATMSAEGTVHRHGPTRTPEPPHVHGSDGILSTAGLDFGGSLGLSEGFLGSLAKVPSSMALSSWSSLAGSSSWSSPVGEASQPPFQLTVNAELIIHGTTEPDATLLVGDQIIQLTADGTFRLRFTLPDGAHQVAFKAISARTGEQREGQLCFTRQTLTSDAVGATPQTHALKIPGAETL